MGKLVTIVGNNGSGKTTLAKALGEISGMTAYLESHEDRPYQSLFSKDLHLYALPNQMDYFLTRAEQEVVIRDRAEIGVQDGGLDQDYYLYTHLFHHKGLLDEKGFQLCQRFYQVFRQTMLAPDLIVWLKVPLKVLRERLLARNRLIDLEGIVTLDDLPVLEGYLQRWMENVAVDSVWPVEVGEEQRVDYAQLTEKVFRQI